MFNTFLKKYRHIGAKNTVSVYRLTFPKSKQSLLISFYNIYYTGTP